jgi:hypothetical protein
MTVRKTIIVFISILFTGALLLYTVQANLDLLVKVSPNPQFVGFALLTVEGGVIYWLAYYLTHWNGVHKGIAVCMIFVDFVFAMTGFFVDENSVAMEHGLGTSLQNWFPHVILIVTLDIAINVFMGILIHLLPGKSTTTIAEELSPLAIRTRQVASGLKNRVTSRTNGAGNTPDSTTQP